MNTSNETKKIFKNLIDENVPKIELNLSIKRTHPVLGNSDSCAGEVTRLQRKTSRIKKDSNRH